MLGAQSQDCKKKLNNFYQSLVQSNNFEPAKEGKKEVEDYYSEELDPDGRGYKNLMRMMNDDGIFKYLPKLMKYLFQV